jgi:hypothetical protein
MANRYWVGGTNTWNSIAGLKWSATSGGPGGASRPQNVDDVFFDANSGSGTVTIAFGNAGAKSINCTGFTGTLTGSYQIIVYGSITLAASMNFTYSATMIMVATGTLTTAGKLFGFLTIDGFASPSTTVVTLGDPLNTSANSISVVRGTFDTANYNVTTGALNSSGSGIRGINLGSSTVTITGTGGVNFVNNTNLTFNAGTSDIVLTSFNGSVNGGTGVTFHNLSFTSTDPYIHGILGANTINNLSVTAPASPGQTLLILASQTINGTLSTTGSAGNRRVYIAYSGITPPSTLTINSTPSLTDIDFVGIHVIGTAAPISGTRIGNRLNCSGITFSTPKTVYWVTAGGGDWSGNNWATTSGGVASTDNFPLPQDTAIIENTGLNTSATVTLDGALNEFGTIDASTRTNSMTLSGTAVSTFYGGFFLGSGVTNSYTGLITSFNYFQDTLSITDEISGGLRFDSSVSELSTGTDTISPQLIAKCTISELSTASDSFLSIGVFNPLFQDTVVGTDTLVGNVVFQSFLQDTATGDDQFVRTVSLNSIVLESSIGTDTVSPVLLIPRSFSDSVTASAINSSSAIFVSSVSELASGLDVVSPISSFLSSVLETVTGTDTISPQLIAKCNISELSTTADSFLSTGVFNLSFQDTVVGTDTLVGNVVFQSFLQDTATGDDQFVCTISLNSIILESSTGTDTTSAVQTFVVNVQEQASAFDTFVVAPSVFNATSQDIFVAVDSIAAGMLINSLITEQVILGDTVLAAFLWTPVDDSQGAVWTDVNNSQGASWTPVIP